MSKDVKGAADGRQMWEAVRWNTFDDRIIYRSNNWDAPPPQVSVHQSVSGLGPGNLTHLVTSKRLSSSRLEP